ncbi:SAM-dependent methyltransferase [Fluviispira vulneris]|uniref:SAM-dependent methyltransferase n=1 Tax=Fluviispira vulneris TaxID=2763012 RepID=UPI0016486BBC|nr:SAM-dependent methyltransferase [Fluviispira vulneris]
MTLIKNDSVLWLAHVAKDFFPTWQNRLNLTEKNIIKPLGHNFYSVQFNSTPTRGFLSDTLFSRYWLPVHYMWPTKCEEKGFIEKCAQGLLAKFKDKNFNNVVVFSLDRKQQKLASNLRGRILQVFSEKLKEKSPAKLLTGWTKKPILQPIYNQTLIVAISDKCTWAGLSTPSEAGSFFAGGRRYVGVSNESIASRAAAKFVEAAESLQLSGLKIENAKKWLELGAAPGGITHELVEKKCEVWAVDKADLDEEIAENPLVHFYQMDARDFKINMNFDALMCDLNGPANISAKICSDKTSLLKKDGIVIFTLKIHISENFEKDYEQALKEFSLKNCQFLYGRHLYNNKQEITLFFKKK